MRGNLNFIVFPQKRISTGQFIIMRRMTMENLSMRNIGVGVFSIAFSTVLGTGTAMASCVTAPSCASLGYAFTAADCKGPMLFCPFDKSKVYCKADVIKPTSCEMAGYLSTIPFGQSCTSLQVPLTSGTKTCYAGCAGRALTEAECKTKYKPTSDCFDSCYDWNYYYNSTMVAANPECGKFPSMRSCSEGNNYYCGGNSRSS